MRVLLTLCRVLVWLHPRAFRERHGEALLATVEEALRRRAGVARSTRIVLNLAVGVVTERLGRVNARERRRAMRVEALVHEVRAAARVLTRTPAHSAVAMLTLGIGVAACVALFSVLNAVVLRPLPYPEPDRLVHLWARNDAQGTDRYVVSQPDFDDWRAHNTTFENLAAYRPGRDALLDGDAAPEAVHAAWTTWNFFGLLGVRPLAGRVFAASDGEPGAPAVAVLSEAYWHRRFGGDPGVIGRIIQLDGMANEVVGIIPNAQAFPNDVQVWYPMNFTLTSPTRSARWLSVIGRLRPGVTLETARQDMATVAARLAAEHPDDRGWGVTVLDLRTTLVGDARRALILLFGAAAMVLVVACANVAGMTLLRAQQRMRELAVRSSLGATRLRISALLMTESLILSAGGTALGLGVAALLLGALPGLALGGLPRIEDVRLDGASVLVAGGCIVLTALVLGLAPSFQIGRGSLSGVLIESARGTTGGRARAQLRSAFVIAQIAAAVVLVMGAVQLGRSFDRLLEIEPGFVAENVVTMELDLQTGYPDFGATARFQHELETRLAAVPGVTAAGFTTSLPFGDANDYFQPIRLPDAPVPPQGEVRAWLRQVSPGFMDALRIPLVRGRALSADDRDIAEPVVLINETFARRYFGSADPIGRHISDTAMRIGPLGLLPNDVVEIVGIVADVHYDDLRAPPAPTVYFPLQQAPFRRTILAIRSRWSTVEAAGVVRSLLAEMDPTLPVSDVASLQSRVERELAPDRRNLLLIGAFGAIALLLSGLGVFGVVSWSARQRVPEFGIRLAIGARPTTLLALVLRQALVLVLIGIAAGMLATLPTMRILSSQLYGVAPADPLSLLLVSTLLALTGIVAGLVPALRATRMDPLHALRNG